MKKKRKNTKPKERPQQNRAQKKKNLGQEKQQQVYSITESTFTSKQPQTRTTISAYNIEQYKNNKKQYRLTLNQEKYIET